MSPIARALHERFDEVCRNELQRLRRKTAALSPEERAEVDAISREVTMAIAARFEAALEAHDGRAIAELVGRLFAVEPGGPAEGVPKARAAF
jgi:hypothetical protein